MANDPTRFPVEHPLSATERGPGGEVSVGHPDSYRFAFGSRNWEVAVLPSKRRGDALPEFDLSIPAGARLEKSLEKPFGLNVPLRKALTPGDGVCIVLDESTPQLDVLLPVLLEHLDSAHIEAGAITILVPSPSGDQTWIDALPEQFEDVRIEVHDPGNPKKLAFLGSTEAGERIDLNRTLVEAEFAIVLGVRRYDPDLGILGGELAIFPTLSDRGTQTAWYERRKTHPNRARKEASEMAWKLGSPFYIQIVEGPADSIAEIVSGFSDAVSQGVKKLANKWKRTVGELADLVVVPISDPAGMVSQRELCGALENAAGVGNADAPLALLFDGELELGDESTQRRWADLAEQHRLFVANEQAEALDATPLGSERELQRLIDAAESVRLLPDAHRIKLEEIEA